MNAPRIAVLALPAAVLLGGCSDGFVPEGALPEYGESAIPGYGDSESGCEALFSEVSIRSAAGVETSSFADGELVTIRTVVSNIGASLAAIDIDVYESCGPAYVDVVDAGGTRLWAGACPPGHLCSCASDRVTLGPGESITIWDTWDQRLQPSGDLAPAGTYSGRANDASECAPLLNDASDFTLVR